MEKYLTIGETAKRLDLEVDTVRKLARSGKIRAARTKGGHRRFTEEEIDRYRRSCRERGPARSNLTGHRQAPSRGAASKPASCRPPLLDHLRGKLFDALDEDLDTAEADLPIDEFEEEDVEFNEHPSPLRPSPLKKMTPPKRVAFAPAPVPVHTAPAVDTGGADRLRLQMIKSYGRSAIPWDVPPEWEGKVIADLERFVTPVQFPADLSFSKAGDIVRARVTETLRPYREAEEQATREKKAKEEADRRQAALIAHGTQHARQEAGDWDWSSRTDALGEVERVLKREVKDDWTEIEVENAVDEILDEWDDEEAEEGDDE